MESIDEMQGVFCIKSKGNVEIVEVDFIIQYGI